MKTLEQAVEAKARAEAEAALAEARREAQAHWERESERLRREYERRREAARTAFQAAVEQETNTLEGRNRQAVLARKNEILDQVFQAATQGVLNLPADGYRAWLRTQLTRLPDEPLEILTNPRDRDATADLLRELRRPNLRLSGRSAFVKGGFLAVGASRDFDYSLDALMSVQREALTERVAALLFGEEKT